MQYRLRCGISYIFDIFDIFRTLLRTPYSKLALWESGTASGDIYPANHSLSMLL